MPTVISSDLPVFQAADFKCPHCRIYASQAWYPAHDHSDGQPIRPLQQLWTSRCLRCKERSVWWDGNLIYPSLESAAPPPADFMPENVKHDFLEAREIFASSPRGACGLLRVAAEKLCADILGKDKNFNGAIGELVRQGVSADVQRSLDIVRLHGNDALHPGQVSDSDTRERALFMFTLLNVLVDERIGLIKRLNSAYSSLPEPLVGQIQRRDSNSVKLEAARNA